MNNLKIITNFDGIDIDVNITNKFGVLVGNSGTGKTLLMQVIILFCRKNEIKYMHCNYDTVNLTEEQIIDQCMNKEIILFDNADLYLTDNIVKTLQQDKDKFILVSLKDLSLIDIYTAARYITEYDNKKLTVREL